MTFTSTFTYYRSFSVALCALAATACGDDESAKVTPGTDAGEETQAAATSEATSTAAAATSDTVQVHDSGATSACATVATACDGKRDEDGLGELCLDVSDSGNEVECSVVSSACLTFCETGNLPAAEAGAPSEGQCQEMGELCHDYDEGSGLGHLCHEVGHGGNLEWCSVIYSACAELCHIEASDGGSHHHDDGDASHDGGHHEPNDGGHREVDASHHDDGDASHADWHSNPDAARDAGH